MKRVEAIIRPEKLHEVQRRLDQIGAPGLTISDVRGHGQEKGLRGTWRGDPYVLQVIHKIKVEVVCEDHEAEQIGRAILDAGRTGQLGDGVVFVTPVERVWEIRTGLDMTRMV